jgi:hypothetical protein
VVAVVWWGVVYDRLLRLGTCRLEYMCYGRMNGCSIGKGCSVQYARLGAGVMKVEMTVPVFYSL